MLTLFSSLRTRAVPHVAIFRDHADPQQFFVIPDRPGIAREPDGTPLFNFSLFSRDIDIAYASAGEDGVVESQLGQLNMTVDLSLTSGELAALTAFLRGVLTEERTQPSAYNKIFGTRTRGTEPRIDYPNTWTEGTVQLAILEGLGQTFQRASSKESRPNLQGVLSASLWATFGSEGAQLMWKSLEGDGDGEDGDGDTAPVHANVVYHLKGYHRIPSIKIDVVADGETVYQELREQTRVYESGGGKTYRYPQISELTKSLVENDVIQVNEEDWSIPGVDSEVNQEIRQTVMSLITNHIITNFFESAVMSGVQEDDLGSTFPHLGHDVPGNKLWLKEYEEGYYPHIEFHYQRSQNVAFEANPQTSLLTQLTAEQAEDLVRIVDVGSPEVRWMEVHVTTNADFEGDNIHRINVQLDYDEDDTLTGERLQKSAAYSFVTGEETFVFRTRMARDREGALIDTYRARAQIIYRGTSEAPPPLEYEGISDRALTFSYDRLGYVKVMVQAGDVDWDEIEEIYVDLEYTPAGGEPDAAKQVKLTRDEPVAHWTANKHGRDSNRYQYTVRYVLADGSETETRTRYADRGTLLVHDQLSSVLRRTFDVVMDPATVQSVIVRVRYRDPRADEAPHLASQIFEATGSWDYERRLTEGAPQALEYSAIIQYADGESTESPWTTVEPGDDVPIIKARRHKLTLRVDGGGLDWDTWRVAYVNLTYRDDEHGYGKSEELRIDKDNQTATMEAWAFAFDRREFGYRATLVPRGGDPVEVPADGSEARHRGVLLLETLVED